MKIITQLLFLFLATTIYSQNKGDNFRKNGDLEKAIRAYSTEYFTNKNDAKNTYKLASTYSLMYQKDSAFHYLKIALKNDTRLWALADNDFYPLTKDTRWNGIENLQFKKFQVKNGKIKNQTYAKQLIRLIIKDQALDYQQDMARNYFMKNGKAPHWFYPIMQQKKEIASDNFAKMKQLVKEYGLSLIHI